jgi:tetratricopeptide (TPR) repeat protein
MTRVFAALLALVLFPQAATDEDVIRALVQQYYDAQTKKDADKAAGFWSTAVNPRISRESFLAVFGAGDAEYAADVQAVTIKGNEARVRVALAIARTIVRNDVPGVMRQTTLNAQLWRREGATWKLIRDGPLAEDFADDLIAAAHADRARLMAENPTELNSSLRYVLAQRASALASGFPGQYAKARELFELALAVARATKDRRSESETLQNIANAYYFLKDYPNAIDSYQQRLTLSREMDDAEATAASLLGLATVAYSRAEYTPALASYREALAIYEKWEEGASIGRTLVSVGNVQYLQAEYDEATASYRRALNLLVAGMDPQGAAFARNGLARVFAAQGDLAAALDTYGQVLSEARARTLMAPSAKTEVAAALESIGDLHFRLANTDQARASFDEARRLADSNPGAAGRLFGSLGLTEIVAGRFDAALANYTESRTRFEAGKIPDGVAHAWVGIGFSHAAREKYADAIAAYRTAIRLLEEQKHNEDSGRAWLGLSMAQSGAADYPAALESAQRVRTIAALVKSEDLAWRADVRVGEVLRKLSRIDEARRSFADAITAIDRLAADAPTNPEARRQLDDSASAWTGLALALATQGDAPGALAAVEARRAHIRRVQFAGFQRDITRGATAEEQAAEQGIVRELVSTRAQVRAAQSAGRPDPARLERLQQQLTTLLTRRTDQQARLYARLPELEQWRGLPPASPKPRSGEGGKPPSGEGGPKPPGDLNALVPDARALLVEYLVADDELLVVSVAHGEAAPDVVTTLVPLKRRDFADKVEQAMQPAVLKDVVEWRKKSAPIATVLLEPIAARFRDRDRVVVVPDDLLWRVPFEALPAGEGDLSSQARVTYATSLATLAVQRSVAEATAPPGHLVAGIAGAPAIPAAIRAQAALTSQGWKEPDADASLAAAREIAKVYGDAATLRTGADATEAAVRALLETSDIVHVLAPLQISGPTPLFSSLLLGGSVDTLENDGRWEAREWFNLDGRARVMVIPDASTFGAAGVGGAMDAFAWAAAAAKVSSLVIGRWPGDGFAPEAFLSALHAQLAKGVPVGEAWRAATVSTRENAGAAPAGWAGLRLIGGG